MHGVSVALRDPVVGALIAEHGGKKRIAQSFAWYQTAKSVAGNAGKALAPMLLIAFSNDYSLVFLAATLLSAIPIIVVVLYVRDPPRDSRMSAVAVVAEDRPPPAAPDSPVPRKTLASFIGLGFMVSATANMLSGLFPLIVVEYAGLPARGPLAAVRDRHARRADRSRLGLGGRQRRQPARPVGAQLLQRLLLRAVHRCGRRCRASRSAKALDDTGKAAFKPAWGVDDGHAGGPGQDAAARGCSAT